MSKLISPFETAYRLKEQDNFLLITHRRPDGDTIGSASALAQGLRELGKTAGARRHAGKMVGHFHDHNDRYHRNDSLRYSRFYYGYYIRCT